MATKPHGQRQETPQLDRFADLLAREISPPDAAELMGRPRRYGREMLAKIRARLGSQAS